MNNFFHFLVTVLAISITAYILPGVSVSGVLTYFIIAIILAVVNLIIRPIVLLLTLPLNILTLGLFTFVINALMVLLVATLVPGFKVDGFWWALTFSLVLSLVQMVLFTFFK